MYKPLPRIMESIDELKQCMKHEAHALKRQRLHALYLAASMQATQRQQIATGLRISRNAVGRWFEVYE